MTYYARHMTDAYKPARRLRGWITALIVIASLMLPVLAPALAAVFASPVDPPTLPALIINEIQTSGCVSLNPCSEDTKMEFVELYNTQNTSLQISGWKLRYISASGGTITDLVSLSGQITGHGYVLVAHAGYYPEADLFFGTTSSAGVLAKTAGHVDLADSSNTSVDKVGWGTAAVQAQTKPITTMTPGQSAERATLASGLPSYSSNNFNDFTVQTTPTPQAGGYTATAIIEPPTIPSADPVETPTPQANTSCSGVIISELLPNPAGTDTGHEFIELANPTDEVIDLAGCSLQSSASTTKTFAFGPISMHPGEYRSFSDSTTGLSLPNSAGGTVWLTDATVELQAITYPGDMDDDTVWALTGGNWTTSYTQTPDSINIATPLKPCDVGEVRNPDTNRCGSVSTATTTASDASSTASTGATSTATACKPGQERNPATNRCRAIAAASTNTAAACKAGQERNPETNRCRSIATAASTAKDCPAGQERNAETNRCRKITAAGSTNGSSLTGVKDVASTPSAKSKPYWLIAGVLIIAAISYGIYEWRQEVIDFFGKRFSKQKPSSDLALPISS